MLIYIILLINEWGGFVSEIKIYIVFIDDLHKFSMQETIQLKTMYPCNRYKIAVLYVMQCNQYAICNMQ